MGKRSNFKRIERDFYPTPLHAVEPLFPYLTWGDTYVEPCAGDGRLVEHLAVGGQVCVRAMDIEPTNDGIEKMDAFDDFEADLIITNPPWDRKILHPMIEHFTSIAPTWLLFDADWMHTKQSAPYMEWCSKIVSIGRVKWFDNTAGKDNAVWYLFDRNAKETIFHGRINEKPKNQIKLF